MKTVFLGGCLWAISIGVCSCTDEASGNDGHNVDSEETGSTDSDSNTTDETDEIDGTDTDNETEDDSASENEETIYTFDEAECRAFCELQWDCLGIGDSSDHPMYDCEQVCAVNVPFLNCVPRLLAQPCRSIYTAAIHCEYSISSCEEFDEYSEVAMAVADDDPATTADPTNMCGTEMSNFHDDCAEELEPALEADPETCAEELAALTEYMDSY